MALPAEKQGGEPTRFVMTFRTGPEILSYVNGTELADYSQRGVVTPDHIIRTKNTPLVLPPPEPGKLEDFARHVQDAVQEFNDRYDAYFGRENERAGNTKTKLDSARAWCSCRGLACSASAARRRTPTWLPISPRTRCGW